MGVLVGGWDSLGRMHGLCALGPLSPSEHMWGWGRLTCACDVTFAQGRAGHTLQIRH